MQDRRPKKKNLSKQQPKSRKTGWKEYIEYLYINKSHLQREGWGVRQGQTSSTTGAYLSWKLGSYRCWGRAGSRRPDGRPSAGPCRGWCGRRRNGRRSRCSRAPRPRQTGRLQHACVTSNQHQSRYLCMHIATTYSDEKTRKVWSEGGMGSLWGFLNC